MVVEENDAAVEAITKKRKKKVEKETEEEKNAKKKKKKEAAKGWKEKRNVIEKPEKYSEFVSKHTKEMMRYIESLYV